MLKILTVLGARPQFVKASVVSMAIAKHQALRETIVHTGQHFDSNMSAVFFDELGIPRPDHQLEIHGGGHGEMTGRMLGDIERLILQEQPDRVLVYGDTNSTLAGALAAAKLHVPVAHIEAGLRSFNMNMPEEINRILTDHVSDILFCPTDASVSNLMQEGFRHKRAEVLNVGDVMQDAALFFAERAIPPAGFRESASFILATFHRAENTDDPQRLAAIVNALNGLHATSAPVVVPLHPRTRDAIQRDGLSLNVETIDPVGYLEMLWLLRRCSVVLTDSGGVQKEAFFFGKACVTMRDETEWVELVDLGVNCLVGVETDLIHEAVRANLGRHVEDQSQLYGGGMAAGRIVQRLLETRAK